MLSYNNAYPQMPGPGGGFEMGAMPPQMMSQGGPLGYSPQAVPFPGQSYPQQQMAPQQTYPQQQMPTQQAYPVQQQQFQAVPQPLAMTAGAAGQQAHGIRADVIQLAGCMDSQSTQDVEKTGLPAVMGMAKTGGAMTNAIVSVMAKGGVFSYRSLLVEMQQQLTKNRYAQLTQLSSSKPVDLNQPVQIKPANARRTKALFIGINYKGTRGELDGCHNDVRKMMQFAQHHGYSMDPTSCRVLMDDGRSVMPTKANIWDAFNWLIEGAVPGDALFLHFSGHGGQKVDVSGDEADGYDETMIPVDFATAGQILDDDILARVIKPLPAGVTMFSVMDCCHSGTIMDLPFTVAVDENTGRALTSGQMTQLAGNRKFTNKGKKRGLDGEEAGLAAFCAGCGLCCVDVCDLAGDSKHGQGNALNDGAGTGAAMMCGGIAMCCADWCDLCGDSKKPQQQYGGRY